MESELRDIYIQLEFMDILSLSVGFLVVLLGCWIREKVKDRNR